MTTGLTCYRHPNRETGLSCSDCGRGICPDCMVFTPVGIRCPEHAGVPTGTAKVVQGAKRFGIEGTGALLTKILIGINVAVFLLAGRAAAASLCERPTAIRTCTGALNGYRRRERRLVASASPAAFLTPA